MTWWFEAFAEQVPMLGLGVTLILGVGALVVAGVRRRGPASRQAWAEWSVLVALCWVVVTVLPAPRWELAAAASDVAQSDAREPVGEPRPEVLAAPVVARTTPESTDDARPARVGPVLVERSDAQRRVEVPRARPESAAVPAAPQAQPETQSRAGTELTPLLRRAVAIAWLGAAVAALLWLLLGTFGIRRMLRRAVVAADLPAELRAAVRASHRRAIVLVSADAPRPFVCGWLRPRVVLPESLLVPSQRATLAHVLAHECAHLAHGDLRGRYLLAVAMPVLCWNPLYWWLRARIRLDAELRADARAAGAAPIDYAKALVDYASRAVDRPLPAAARPLAAFASRSEFVRRMHMLLDRRTPAHPTTVSPRARVLRWVLTPLLVCGSASLFGVPLPAQDLGGQVVELRRENARLRQQVAEQEAKVDALMAQVRAMVDAQVQEKVSGTDAAGARRMVTLEEVLENAAGRLEREVDVPEEVLERYRRAVVDAYERIQADRGSLGRLVQDPELVDQLDRVVSGFRNFAERSFVEIGDEAIVYDSSLVEEPVEIEDVEPIEEVVVEEVLEPVPPRADVQRAPSTGGLPDSLAVLELASRKVDADIAMQEAAEQVQRLEPLVDSGQVSASELRRAQLDFERARRKSDIAGNLIRMEIEALDAEIKLQQQLIDGGYAPQDGRLRRMIGLREQLALAL